MAQWKTVKLGDIFHQYRNEIWVDDAQTYGQITISKKGTASFRCRKIGKSIGRKRQFKINLQENPSTMLFTRQGVTDGAIAFAPDEVDQCIATENMPMFSLDETMATKIFIQHLLLSTQFKSEIAKIVPTGSAQKSIHERELMQISICLPPLEKQKEIETRLEQQSDLSGLLNSEITGQQALLKKLRQSILQDAIQGKLTADWRKAHPDTEPATDLLERIQAEKQKLIAAKKIRKQKSLPPINPKEILFEIPEGWAWCRYRDICEYITSGSRGWQKYYAKEGALFIRAQNIKTDELILNDKAYVKLPFKVEGKRALVQLGDILVTITGGNVGKTALVKEQPEEAYISQHIALTRLIEASSARYLFLNFMSDAGVRGQLMKFVKGAKPGLTLENIQNLHIPLPPLAEQEAIVAQVEKLFGMMNELEAQTTRSRSDATALMASVLAAAFAPS